ncbi:pilus assembly protein PilP [Neisseria sp. ZJ106]|uniref:Pilus assembly protein PilP n=1 Tax=Neisseria lisongii TaxID=2912188 RepID=A0ABY7RI33_9NEIS|nr:pilus assembly protein PilP [Neisseria lisongii]MCF7522128.1 pilus assembly protein PilP [Neisseria lisongii]WCL70959.1 pilus assembly protein PilP [Neisseria lisongii]
MKPILLAALTIPILCGCSQNHEDLQAWTEQVRRQAAAPTVSQAQPAAAGEAAEHVSATDIFNPQRIAHTSLAAEHSATAERPPQSILETLDLGSVRYVGRLKSGKRIKGYLQADGYVYTVTVGQRIGSSTVRRIDPERMLVGETVLPLTQAVSAAPENTVAAANHTQEDTP